MKQKPMNDTQLTATIASGTIIITSLFYWALQIQAVREMLTLAYG